MILITSGLLKLVPFMKSFGKLTVLTTGQLVLSDVDSIVIEDLGTRDLIPSKFQSIRYTYELASTYMYRINIPQDEFIMITDANNGLDTGFTIRILEEVTSSAKIPEISLIIRVSSIDADEKDRARFYGLAKTVFLYDIYLNSIRPGCFRYVFVDAASPMQIFRRTLDILYSAKTQRIYSLLQIKMKRFLVPIAESLLMAKLLGRLGELKDSAEEYSYLVIALNMALDRASPDLWHRARDLVDKFRVSIRSYKSSREGLDKVAEMIGGLLKTVNEGTTYTKSLIDFKSFFETTIKGGVGKALESEEFMKSVEKAVSIESSSLTDLYSQAKIDHYEDYYRLTLASRDMSSFVRKEIQGIIEDAVGEIIVAEIYGIPVDYRGLVNRDFLHHSLYEAYVSRGGLSIDHVHPRKLKFGSVEVDSSTLYSLQPINYRGLMRALEERRGDQYKFLEGMLGIRFI